MENKTFTYQFQDNSPRSVTYECGDSERLTTSVENGIPFVYANRAGMLKDGHLKIARNTIYVVFLPPGVQSTVGSAVGARDYLAYHSHFHSDYGEVHYVVVPFSADVQLEKRAAARSILETSLNQRGSGKTTS